MIDYHVHTRLCNHASGDMDAYIRKAIEIGIREICFLDHLTFPVKDRAQSMNPGEVPLYFQAVQFFKHRYQGKIDVKAGLEIDFHPEYTDVIRKIVQTFSFDVIGASLHSPSGQDVVSRSSAWGHGQLDTDEIYGTYLEQMDKMLDCDYFDVLCHFDLFKKFGRVPSRSVDGQLSALLSKIKEKDLTVEVNSSGYDHVAAEAYPSPDIIRDCYELGIPLTLGSDAHSPEGIGRHFNRVLPILLLSGHRQLAVFTKRRRSSVQIDPSNLQQEKGG